jgi:hypothetical protein
MLVDAAQARQTAMLRPLIEQTLLGIEREIAARSRFFR